MVTVVTIDKKGRVVIPADTRKAQRIRPGTKFLLVDARDGRLWLRRLDAKDLADRIQKELRGVDIRPLVAKVESEIERFAGDRYRSRIRR